MADPKKSYNDILTWAKGTSNDIIAKQLATARTISITNNYGTTLASGTFNGTGNLTLKLPETVGIHISGNAATATDAMHAATANSVKNSLGLIFSDGTREGTQAIYYNGSTAKTVNITPASIGAAERLHTHSYMGTACTTKPTTTSTASAATPCVVVKNYLNGATWGRKWSDGFIEQGGITSTFYGRDMYLNVTFPIAFTATPMVLTNPRATGYYANTAPYNISTTGCSIRREGNNGITDGACAWVAFGY